MSRRSHHHEHSHGHEHAHDHGHGRSHEDVDYGEMYKQPWVQAMVKQIQEFLIANAAWIGIDPERKQKVLDYACGHGTISLAILRANQKAVCRGIDLDATQVDRYNAEASELFGDEPGPRMVGIHGDLYDPTEAMTGAEWTGFDTAIISMALHHVKHPIDMLRRLKERLRPGGTLIVVEFLGKKDEAQKESERQYDAADMIEVPGNQKIWPGFTTGNLESDLKTSGFEGFDVRMLPEPAWIPESARGSGFGGEQWCFFAKTVVPGTAP